MIDVAAFTIDVNSENMQAVLQESLNRPVLLDFYADWCEPCKQLAPVLDTIAQSYAGKILLAKVNADDHRLISDQMGVRGLPALKFVFQGQIVGELSGVQPESVIRQAIDQILSMFSEGGGEVDESAMFLEQIDHAVSVGMIDEAVDALSQRLHVTESDEEKHPLICKLAQIQLGRGETEAVRQLLAQLPSDYDGRASLDAQMAFMNDLDELLPVSDLLKRISVDPSDVEASYQLGIHSVGTQDYDGALEYFLSVMTTDREFRDDAGRLALIRLFDILGSEDARVPVYRRKLFNLLH